MYSLLLVKQELTVLDTGQRMAFFIDQDGSDTINAITFLVTFTILIGIPAITLSLFIILTPIFCCCGCMGEKCHRVQKKITNIVQKIFFFLKRDDNRFIVYGYRAPICYTYFLFFMFLVLSVDCMCTFWIGITSKNDELEHLRNNDPDYIHRNCYGDDAVQIDTAINGTCIEIQLIDGFEAASITFGLSALAISFLTCLLLKMTQGNRIRKKRTCGQLCCITSAVILQIVLLVTPRNIILSYAVVFFNGNETDGPFDAKSLFSTIAILDAISLTMLTPWLCFEKVKKPSKETTQEEIS